MKQNKYSYVWVSLVVLVFGIIFIPKIVDRVKDGTIVKSDRMNVKSGDEDLAFITTNGLKRRVPEFTFLNQDSLIVTDKDYLGKVYLVEFFFTTCPSICPVMTKNLVALQDEFKNEENFGVASFSINPRYDKPSVLKTYAEKYGITDLDWNLMTGEHDAIYELANSGFNIYAAEASNAPGGFEHSGLFALVDKRGYLRSRMDKFGNPIIYYRGMILEEHGENATGETEQISILRTDIKKLLEE
ncbi:redoxin domain-containing protein [Kriegella sp. EG-1]|nr:redoxin domain-containing protein [Flavobacteriaceae bacterium EG-1]